MTSAKSIPRLQQQPCLRITAHEKGKMQRMCSNRKARLLDMSGIDAMKEIKDVEPSVLVLIARAYGDEEVAVEAFRSDRDYVKKPCRKNILPVSETPA